MKTLALLLMGLSVCFLRADPPNPGPAQDAATVANTNAAAAASKAYLESLYFAQGNAKAHKGDYDGAIGDYTRAIELNPQNCYSYCDRGMAKGQKGDLDGAISDFNQAIEINPRDCYSYYSRGYTKYLKGDLDGAITDDTQAIELNPRLADADLADAYRNRGRAKGKKGDVDGAIADDTQAIEINPRYADAYADRATVKEKKGDHEGALSDYNKAISLRRAQNSNSSASPPSDSTQSPPPRPTVKDSSGHSYWVSEADYQRLHPISLELGADGQTLDKMEARLDAKAHRVEIDRKYLDNTDAQSVDDFNLEVDSYNSYRAYVGKQTDDYNTRVNAFNSELHRVGTLAQ